MAKARAEVGSTANKYQLLERLAAGGMAEIFLAHATSAAGVERYCVLKRILPERAQDADLVRMFVDEARLAAQLQHPNIASVHDIGMLGGSYFFTMEYVHGETVRAVIERASELHRTVPLACVLTIIAGAAAGLHHAHDRHGHDGRPLGIVHRDVSPSNLMVSYEGNLKLVDFGVAKAADRANETKAGMVKGKIAYLSPEQCRSAPVDRRSDLFSLGIVLWELLTGARLYRRANDFETMSAIVGDPAPAPSTIRRDIPPEIDDLTLRLLAKSRSDRFQTAGDVVEAIEHAAMRAGAPLSSSAVSRLLRELFGTRVEPWREAEVQATWSEIATVAARPLARAVELSDDDVLESEDLVDGDSAIVELGLSAVIELDPAVLDDEAGQESGEIDDLADPPAHSSIIELIQRRPAPSSIELRPSYQALANVALPPVQRASSIHEETTSVSGRLAAELLPPTPPSAMPRGFAPPSLDPHERTAAMRGMRRLAGPLVGVILTATVVGLGVAWLSIRHRRIAPAAVTAPSEPIAPAPAPEPAPPPTIAPPAPATFEALSARYEAHDYQGVVTACSTAASPAGITTICLMAACHTGDLAQAKRWLAAQPPARRGQLARTCSKLGNLVLEAGPTP